VLEDLGQQKQEGFRRLEDDSFRAKLETIKKDGDMRIRVTLRPFAASHGKDEGLLGGKENHAMAPTAGVQNGEKARFQKRE